MKVLITIILTVSFSLVFSQQKKEWLDKIENEDFMHILKNENSIDKYKHFDFSNLITPETEFLGFIGKDFQRIRVEFKEVQKETDYKYFVTGYSLVKTNKCDFDGIIEILEIREYKEMHFGVDNMHENDGMKSQGILIGKYKLQEKKEQKHSGIFEGTVTLKWFVDKNNKIQYDKLELFSDSYSNNQYIGIWTMYNSELTKVCNWGEYRIPFSGDLDIGAGEFSPNSKYKDKGWNE